MGDTADQDPLVETVGLGRDFRVRRGLGSRPATLRAVHEVSITIGRGQTVGVVGESGCGKSTLARMVLGLVTPTSGTVRFDRMTVSRTTMKAVRARAQMVFQDPHSSLDPRMTVGRSIEEPLRVHTRRSRRQRREAAAEVLEAVGLRPDVLDRYPHEFSGGQLQRIGIARALIIEPDLLVCDEPVSALDVSVQAQVLNLLRQIQDDRGLSYLFVSHDLGVIRFVADQIVVMYLGRVMEIADRDDFFSRPEHPYSHVLLAAVPTVGERPVVDPDEVPVVGDPPSPLNPPPGCPFQTRCPTVMDVCRQAMPRLREIRPGHQVACHAVDQEGTPAEPLGVVST